VEFQLIGPASFHSLSAASKRYLCDGNKSHIA